MKIADWAVSARARKRLSLSCSAAAGSRWDLLESLATATALAAEWVPGGVSGGRNGFVIAGRGRVNASYNPFFHGKLQKRANPRRGHNYLVINPLTHAVFAHASAGRRLLDALHCV